ncbi:MAG: glutamine-hydrolyzing GMP synthase, partial [Proteobacteria bacterium]|nr:glutamine-hydrolyzing GMP synthase [Pseudomonadota bacterium]
MSIHTQKIVILDFGSQTTQLIARRIREQKVYSEIHPYTLALDKLAAMRPTGIVLSGSPASVYDDDAPISDPGIYGLGVPVLGICYGAQLMTTQLGGRVEQAEKREFGEAQLHVESAGGLFAGMAVAPSHHQVWMSHGDRIETLAPGFAITATSAHSPYAAIHHGDKPLVGVQFHPEVAHTLIGTDVLRNFVFGLCGCRPDWTMQSFIDATVAEIRAKVGNDRVICALSGGVDSSVTAALVHQAIGEQLTCIYVNTGLMRAGESESVLRFFRDQTKLEVIDVDASEYFLAALAGIKDPEEKRKRIGYSFIEIFEAEAKKLGQVRYLAQGT